MQMGIFQGPAAAGFPADMLGALAKAAETAAARGVTLLVLPELFLTGYNIGGAAIHALAETADGPSAAAMSAIARQHGLALLYGYPERAGPNRLYNSAQLIGRDGTRLANYRKVHLFGAMEREVFTAGDDPCVIAEIDGLKLGVLVCYDVEFPEMVRGLALREADLVAVPTALMHPYDFVPRVMVPARAYENQVFLAYANRCGTEGDLIYTGASCIIAPDGSELARARSGDELIMANLDLALMARSRGLNTYLQDRRPDLYAEPSRPEFERRG